MTRPFATTIRCLLCATCVGNLIADDSNAPRAMHLQRLRIGTSEAQVELREGPESATFVVKGLPKISLLQKMQVEDLQKHFTIRVHHSDSSNTPSSMVPPLLGTYAVMDGEIWFTTQFPLSRSVEYRVELDSHMIEDPFDAQAMVFSSQPKERMPAATIAAIFPSSDVLPENVLKFYIHFSAPMSRGEAYSRIHLRHDGREVNSPFLELGEELWNAEQTRFTLFVHPGRIKRGLKPREDSGIPIEEGKEYTLQVDADWKGADLQPLTSGFIKKFRVGPADVNQPDPKKWKVATPEANSNQPVTLTFDEPLDHAMLNRVVRVRDAANKELVGTASIQSMETEWSFQPNVPWRAGNYSIELSTKIEDLAGNNLARRFETEEGASEVRETTDAKFVLKFVVQ